MSLETDWSTTSSYMFSTSRNLEKSSKMSSLKRGSSWRWQYNNPMNLSSFTQMTSIDSRKAELVIMRMLLPLMFVRKLSILVTQQVAQVTTDFLIYIQYMWLVCLKRWDIFPSTSFVAPKMLALKRRMQFSCLVILKSLWGRTLRTQVWLHYTKYILSILQICSGAGKREKHNTLMDAVWRNLRACRLVRAVLACRGWWSAAEPLWRISCAQCCCRNHISYKHTAERHSHSVTPKKHSLLLLSDISFAKSLF